MPAGTHVASQTRRYRTLVTSDAQIARLLQKDVADREASVDFTKQSATVVHFCCVRSSECEASVNCKLPRRDSITFWLLRKLRLRGFRGFSRGSLRGKHQRQAQTQAEKDCSPNSRKQNSRLAEIVRFVLWPLSKIHIFLSFVRME